MGSTKVVELWTRCVVGSWASRRDLLNICQHLTLSRSCAPPRATNAAHARTVQNVWRLSRRDVPRIKNRAFIKAFESAVDLYIEGVWDTAMEKLHECEQVCTRMSVIVCFNSCTLNRSPVERSINRETRRRLRSWTRFSEWV